MSGQTWNSCSRKYRILQDLFQEGSWRIRQGEDCTQGIVRFLGCTYIRQGDRNKSCNWIVISDQEPNAGPITINDMKCRATTDRYRWSFISIGSNHWRSRWVSYIVENILDRIFGIDPIVVLLVASTEINRPGGNGWRSGKCIGYNLDVVFENTAKTRLVGAKL